MPNFQKTADAIKILMHQIQHDSEAVRRLEEATSNAHVAQTIYKARKEGSGLWQN